MIEKRFVRIYQWVVVLAAGLIILLMLILGLFSGRNLEWRKIQRGFEVHSSSILIPEGLEKPSIEKGIHELSPKGMEATDRCITCHVGIDNPLTEGLPQPYGYHPGNHLHLHPVEKYGCTICHDGQGRALNSREAHAVESDVHWDQPLKQGGFVQSSCGKCHLTIFSESRAMDGTDVFVRGHEIFQKEGCLGCHKARGLGGILGPDLTEQGEKTSHEYSFQYIETEKTVVNWLKEHFRDPEMVSPGSQMLKIDLPIEDLNALSTFVLGLTKPDISFEFFSAETLLELKGEREELKGDVVYDLACGACHGKQGEGKDYEAFKVGVPAILNRDFLRTASLDYIQFTLQKGRSKKQMASWLEDVSGLLSEEMLALVHYVDGSGATTDETFRNSKLRDADAFNGAALYAKHCAACHGDEGKGDAALAVTRADLLRSASNTYIYETMLRGRPNAGMPAWTNLEEELRYDLLRYLRNFGPYAVASIDLKEQKAEEGKLLYHFNCSRCHGEAGQGQTGPALIDEDFLSVAEDAFLYQTISSGREGTAMFGWTTDVYNDERLERKDIEALVSFLKSEAEERMTYIFAGSNPGAWNRGKGLYAHHCAECHGEQGEGLKAPALNNQELLNAASNGYLMATMTVGREGTAMPAWGYVSNEYAQLSARERQDLVAWLRNWERIRIKFH